MLERLLKQLSTTLSFYLYKKALFVYKNLYCLNFGVKTLNNFVKWCLRTFFYIFKTRCAIDFDVKRLPKKGVYVSNHVSYLDPILFSTILGMLLFIYSQKFYQWMKARNGGHAHFPFEKVVLPVVWLLAGSVYFTYFPISL